MEEILGQGNRLLPVKQFHSSWWYIKPFVARLAMRKRNTTWWWCRTPTLWGKSLLLGWPSSHTTLCAHWKYLGDFQRIHVCLQWQHCKWSATHPQSTDLIIDRNTSSSDLRGNMLSYLVFIYSSISTTSNCIRSLIGFPDLHGQFSRQ